MTKLTKRQQEILNLIQSHLTATGSPPTRAEIAKTMGFRSPNAAEDHLRALARKGVIELVPGTSRGIRLASNLSGIPIIRADRLGSNQPILSDNHLENRCRLDRGLFTTATDCLIHIHKALPEFNIMAGDYLALHQTQEVLPGQLMAGRVNQEIVVRRATSDPMQPNFIVEGMVVGVIRSLTKNALLS